LRYLQIGSSTIALDITGDLWEEAQRLVDIRTWQRLLSLEELYSHFHPYARESKALSRRLALVDQVMLFAATIGGELEKRSREYLNQNEVFRGYVLDRMGSYLVEAEIRRLDSLFRLEFEEKGFRAAQRFSPGYQDFSLESQQVFFRMMEPSIPGLLLTPAFLFKPEKTVTALKGLQFP
jgi:hypothetical protein